MKKIFSTVYFLLKALGLLLLTVLSVLLVNSFFIYLLGTGSHDFQLVFFKSDWSYITFYLVIILALAWSLSSRWLVCLSMKVKLVGEQYPDHGLVHLDRLLKRLARQQGITPPGLGIYRSAEINAFTTGVNQQQAVIVVSSGLLHSLTLDEQEAVIAHELTHIANHDMLNLTLMQSVLNVLVLVPSHLACWLIDKKLLGIARFRGPAYWLTWSSLQLMYGLLATLLVMWFSRWREFRADRGAARMVGNKRMQAVLTCLKESQRDHVLPGELGSFAISGPIGVGVQRLFSSHPPLSERIAALKEDW